MIIRVSCDGQGQVECPGKFECYRRVLTAGATLRQYGNRR